MSTSPRRSGPIAGRESRDIRLLLAVMSAETKLIRLRRLLRKYSPDQPRAPAGQSDGGRWIGPGGGAGRDLIDRLPRGGAQWASLTDPSLVSPNPQRTMLDGGGEVLTLRIHAGRGEWDEQHTVVTPDGESRIFENSGDTQTIRDGRTGEVLSESTFATERAATDATVQPAFLPAVPFVAPFVISPALAATIEAALLLGTYLAAKSVGFGEEPGSIAMRYDFEPDPDKKFPVVWVGKVDQQTLNQFCPHNQEVQDVTDKATRRLTELNPNLNKTRLGSLIHFDIGQTFIGRDYPEIAVEFSLDKSTGREVFYGKKDSVRVDLYEWAPDEMVCVYDPKTGDKGLEFDRALVLARAAKRHFPQSRGVIMIQVRPHP